ncbi:ribosome biogenesis protein BMS1 homolog isoform X2 [Periplaneta americana]|uniref:ribosome biogenesis protein BMS1 homolog isoform X2 n=1 Tax=Periplaneta americana TaxID=6978 RepID=UPI0037E8E328
MEDDALQKKKSHRDRHSGRKAEKKKAKNVHVQELTDKQKNPKAFTFNSAIRAERRFRRKQDIETKKQHIPLVDRTPIEPPPVIVAVVGPPKVGKTTLIQCLIKSFTKQPLTSIKGPITLVSGKKRRITLLECNNDINSMIDVAKVADLVLLLVDASFGFEMEIFEFLNICQVHGMPRVMGVLTHLDMLKNNKQLKKTKKTLKHRFWAEVYAGAKLFYLSGLLHGEYLRNEVKNLGRFISVMKFRPLTWRTTHPYILADRLEDLTPPELIRQNPKVDRLISLYGFVRGVALNKLSSIHIPGCGDLRIHDVSHLPDPCPLPDKLKKRSLVEKEKLIYAPFSGVGGIVYDKDAVYVELRGSHSHTHQETNNLRHEKALVSSLLETQETLDVKMARSELQLFTGTEPIVASDVSGNWRNLSEELINDSGRSRRKVLFPPHESVDLKEQDSNEESDDELKNTGNLDNSSGSSESESSGETGVSDKIFDKEFNDSNCLTKDDSKIKRKKPKNAIAAAESKLLRVIDEDDFKSETEDEDVSDMERDDDESDEENYNELPIKRQKLELEENISHRYHGIREDQDREILGKVSSMLSKLKTGKKHHEVKSEVDANVKSDLTASQLEDSGSESNKRSSRKRNCEGTFAVNRFSSDESDDGSIIHNGLLSSKQEDDLSSENNASEIDSESSDSSDEKPEKSAVRWKTDLAKKAADAFLDRQATTHNLWKLVYGDYKRNALDEAASADVENDSDGQEDVGGLFRVVRKKEHHQLQEKDLMNSDDCSKFVVKQLHDWAESDVREMIRDCFVTGKWKESEDAAELLRLDDESDEELFGDFEDLETGERHKKKTEDGNKEEKGNEADNGQTKKLTKEELQEKKRKLKEKFDAEYDDKDGGKTYYDELKQEVDQQAQLNKNEFEGMDDSIRIQLEGYRPGMYVRVEVNDVPCELITNFDPTFPLIVGGLLPGEENIGFVQIRIKKHRWHKKILKTRDPLIISLGWRRFQTLPIYSKLEDNLRHRMLKYTPEHVTCMAHFWGPITPQNTGFLAVQDVATKQADFRIAATGSVVDLDKSTQIVKKLKLTGAPYKIYKKTAFIKDMFNSTLEVAKFEGAKLKTVSGIRGQIKKAVSKPEGAFRATFEDKILLSDIVFCRTWYRVEVPKLYNPVTSLLLPLEQKNQWRGMKTVGQLKREKGIRSEPTSDSLYTAIERQPRAFKPLIIPRTLQKELPYKDKPKMKTTNEKKSIESGRIAVVREPHEQKVASLMKMLKVSYSHKQEQLKQATKMRMLEHKKEVEKEELKKFRRQKQLRKEVFRTLSKLDIKNKTKQRK